MLLKSIGSAGFEHQPILITCEAPPPDTTQAESPRAAAPPKSLTPERVSVVLNYPNGTVFVGKLHDGLPHGMGTLTYPNGDFYEGKFQKGIPNGKGKIIFANRGGDTVQAVSY